MERTSMKIEQVKESAFRDYLKSFSLNMMDTLKKLEREFKEDISENLHLECNMFRRVRTLLNSYQVLILEVNDSFEFVEISQFGCCMLKMFLQMISVVKWSLKCIVTKPPGCETNKTTVSSLAKTTSDQEGESKTLTDKERYKLKEQSKYIMRGLDYDMKGYDEKARQFLNSETLINNILNEKEKVLKMEVSQSENILEQVVKNLSKKGENINQFIEIRQNYMNSTKSNSHSLETYAKIKEVVESETLQKIDKFKHKLQSLFFYHFRSYEHQKQQAMQSQGVQASLQYQTKSKQETKVVNVYVLTQQIHKLEDELFLQMEANASLTKLIEKESTRHEKQLIRQRSQRTNQNKNTFIRGTSAQNTKKHAVIMEVQKDSPQKQNNLGSQSEFNDKFQVGPKRFRTRKKIETTDGFLDIDEDIIEKSQIMNISAVSFKSCKSLKSVRTLRYPTLGLCSQTISFNFHSTHAKFKNLKSAELVTFVDIQEQRSKASQTNFGKHLDSNCAMSSEVISVALFRELEKHPHNKCNSYDTETLIQFNYPQTSRRDHAIRRLALNLSAKSPKTQQISEYNKSIESKETKQRTNKGTFSARAASSNFYTRKYQQQEKSRGNKNTSVDDVIEIVKIGVTKIRASCQLIEKVEFSNSDLVNLFLTEENGKNYQYLNLNNNFRRSKTGQNKAEDMEKRSLLERGPQDNGETQMENKPKAYHQQVRSLGIYLVKQIKIYRKKSMAAGIAIKSFLRYPYTYVRKCREEQWIKYEKQEDQMELWEVRKYLYRILSIHSRCSYAGKSFLCPHIHGFYKKVGINIQ